MWIRNGIWYRLYTRPHLIRLELFSYYSNVKWLLSEPLYIMSASERVTALWLRYGTYNLLNAKIISTEQCSSFGDNTKIPLSHKNRRESNFLRDFLSSMIACRSISFRQRGKSMSYHYKITRCRQTVLVILITLVWIHTKYFHFADGYKHLRCQKLVDSFSIIVSLYTEIVKTDEEGKAG